MNPSNFFFEACLSATLLAACGTSSSNDRTASDGGDDAASASDAAPSCYPFGTPTCAKGQTCCFSGITGACKDLGACASNIQFECANPGGCNPGEICCTTIPPVSAIDASVLSQDGGGGLAELLMGVTATSFCSSTCPSPGVPSCRNTADCAHGAACEQLPEGNIVLVAVGAETLGVCAIGDASVSEGGASENGGSDGAGSDAMVGD